MDIESVWQEYRATVKSFLTARLSNTQDVEDILQEILIATHQHLHTIECKACLKPWLFKVAKHALVDFYRQRDRNGKALTRLDWYERSPATTASALQKCLLPFIKLLPVENANLLLDIDIHHMSQKAYAEKLGISYSTLKSRVQKSRQMLKAIYDDCCHFEIDNRGNVVDYHHKSGFKHKTC